jgi:lipopolysaccharide heptosyltransferase II
LKILILKPSSLGDVIQALPVLRMIRRQLPQSLVYWWIDSRLAPLLEGDPDLTNVVLFHRRGWKSPRQWAGLARTIAWMRKQKFDFVLDLQGLLRSGSIGWMANGARFIGMDEPREGARGFYDQVVLRTSFLTHAVDWYLGTLPLMGLQVDWNFEWLPSRAEAARALERKWPAADYRWIAIQPGARWLNKRWPIEHFIAVVKQLAAADSRLRFAILGADGDKALGNAISTAAGECCLDLSGQTTLPEMVEWVRRCELLISNDTGPMHVAAALRKPVVAMLGPTEERRTGPYGQIANVLRHDLPCAPCLSPRCRYSRPMECLRAISPQAVFEAASARLNHAANGSKPAAPQSSIFLNS